MAISRLEIPASGSKVTGKIEQFKHGKVNKCYDETFTARVG